MVYIIISYLISLYLIRLYILSLYIFTIFHHILKKKKHAYLISLENAKLPQFIHDTGAHPKAPPAAFGEGKTTGFADIILHCSSCLKIMSVVFFFSSFAKWKLFKIQLPDFCHALLEAAKVSNQCSGQRTTNGARPADVKNQRCHGVELCVRPCLDVDWDMATNGAGRSYFQSCK